MTIRQCRATVLITLLAALVAACGAASAGVQTVDASRTVAAAIERAAQTEAYRVTNYVGQRQRVTALGLNIDVPLDPDSPTTIVEVDAEGESHMVMELAAMVPPGTPGAQQLRAELWQDATGVVVDTTSYQLILDIDPTVDLGVFRPGMWSADLAAIDADDSELTSALGASAGLDPRRLAASLLADLDDITVDPLDPTRYSASTRYGAFVRATGQDVGVVARSASEGVSLALGTDPDALERVYTEVYENAPTEISVEIVDGEIRTLDARIDLSSIWSEIAEASDELGVAITAADRAALADAAANAVVEIEMRTEFDFDDSIDVVVPDVPTDDRTTEFAAIMERIAGG